MAVAANKPKLPVRGDFAIKYGTSMPGNELWCVATQSAGTGTMHFVASPTNEPALPTRFVALSFGAVGAGTMLPAPAPPAPHAGGGEDLAPGSSSLLVGQAFTCSSPVFVLMPHPQGAAWQLQSKRMTVTT